MSTVKKILIIAIITIVAATAVFVAFNVVNKNDNPEHQLALAYKLLEEGKYDEAIIAFNKVIDIDGKNIDAHIGLSKAYVKLEDYDEAEKETWDEVNNIFYGYVKLAENSYNSVENKIEAIVKKIYGGDGIVLSDSAKEKINFISKKKFNSFIDDFKNRFDYMKYIDYYKSIGYETVITSTKQNLLNNVDKYLKDKSNTKLIFLND